MSLSSAGTDQPFLQVDRAVVVLDRGIFLGRVRVTRLSLTTPALTVVRNRDGTVNLPNTPPSAPGVRQDPLRLGTISLAGLSVRIDDRLDGRSVAFGPMDLSVDTAAAGRSGSFGPASFVLQVGNVRTAGTVAGRLGFDGTRLRFDGFKVDTREAQVTLDGWADVIGERPLMSSQVTATIDVAQAARLSRVWTHAESPGV